MFPVDYCKQEMADVVSKRNGFIAALDQSGGSTPKTLELYGMDPTKYHSEEHMYSLMHDMRKRIITNQAFSQKAIIGAILFKNTLARTIDGIPTSQYLWNKKNIVPFLKVDKGLEDVIDGVQLMKPIDELKQLIEEASLQGIFGTKMRSVVHMATKQGIERLVEQQFKIAAKIISAGLIPIIEPEVSIHCSEKQVAENILKQAILLHLNRLKDNQRVLLKLTIPELSGFYDVLADHPSVLRLVALSGGYSLQHASSKLSSNKKMIASFSRALCESLTIEQSDKDFSETLSCNVKLIFNASV